MTVVLATLEIGVAQGPADAGVLMKARGTGAASPGALLAARDGEPAGCSLDALRP
jgi:hypothetical protein